MCRLSFLSFALSSKPIGSYQRQKSLKAAHKHIASFLFFILIFLKAQTGESSIFVGDYFQTWINPHLELWGSRTVYVGLSQNKLRCVCVCVW